MKQYVNRKIDDLIVKIKARDYNQSLSDIAVLHMAVVIVDEITNKENDFNFFEWCEIRNELIFRIHE
jgi:hypothetical protein